MTTTRATPCPLRRIDPGSAHRHQCIGEFHPDARRELLQLQPGVVATATLYYVPLRNVTVF